MTNNSAFLSRTSLAKTARRVSPTDDNALVAAQIGNTHTLTVR